MIDLLIISDDLTGAIETGAQFSKKGVPTLITIDVNIDFTALPANVKVVVIDTESRYLDASTAYSMIRDICVNANKVGVTYIYKKTDSTLRGNIGSEFDALLNNLDYSPLCFVPAYPKIKRYTRKGYQYVEDNLLENSIIAAHSAFPVTTSYVPDLLRKQTKIKTRVIPLKYLGKEKIFKQKTKRILIFDAETSSDLRNIGQLLKENDALHLVAGPAGFAELLPGFLQLEGETMPYLKNSKPVLLLNGSLNRVSLEQAEFARVNGYRQVLIPHEILFSREPVSSDRLASLVNEVVSLAREGKHVLIQSLKSRTLLSNYLEQAGVANEDIHELNKRAALNTARIMRTIAEAGVFGHLLVFGNDTTLEIIRALNIKAVFPRTEIVPGLCYANITGDFKDITFVAKSGGFGEIDLVIKITGFLTTKR